MPTSWADIALSFRAFNKSLLMVSCLASPSMMISLRSMLSGKNKAKDPASLPNRREAGKPTTNKEVSGLALESAVERTLQSIALQLHVIVFFEAPLYFFATCQYWLTSH